MFPRTTHRDRRYRQVFRLQMASDVRRNGLGLELVNDHELFPDDTGKIYKRLLSTNQRSAQVGLCVSGT
ncbi:hypothetical protein BVI434_150019 [Burkholderia vietnamiensis]|nr:hypothetical protein BVI434_150019 [Burkholderia vietnamiensis]